MPACLRPLLSVVIPLFVALGTAPATALDLSAPPEGPVLLTVDGRIGLRNAGDAAQLDRAHLEALPAVTFRTGTIWTAGVDEFTGVPLRALLEALGAEGATIRATAANAYSIEIPVDSLDPEAPIVAYRINGEPFPLRRNGPLWVVYPYDADDSYRNELVYGRSIWQLVTITVTD